MVRLPTVGGDSGNWGTILNEFLNQEHNPNGTHGTITPTDIKTKGPWADVRAFGAKGNGTTDDTMAIQNAINSLTSGGVLLFPIGTYLISSMLTYGSNITFRGLGYETIIRVKSGLGSGITMLKPSAVGVTNTRFENLVLDQRSDLYGDSNSLYLLSVNNTVGVSIDHVKFMNVQTMAVWADSAEANPTTNLSIRNCEVNGSESGGFSVFGSVIDADISHNFITGTKDDAIAFQEGTGATQPKRITISNNRILNCNVRGDDGSTASGINLYGCRNATIVGNVIDGTVSAGIYVIKSANFRPSDIAISGNQIDNAGQTESSTTGVPGHAIFIYDSDRVNVQGNTITGSRNSGILVQSCTGVNIGGNISTLNEGNGICIKYTPDVLITGNICLDNGNTATHVDTPYGILLVSTDATNKVDRCIIAHNRCGDTRAEGSKTQTYGVYISGSDTGRVILSENDLTENATGKTGGVAPQDYEKPPRQTSGTAAPTKGTWGVGDVCWNTNATAGGSPGWVCTTEGTPGTWKAMANLAS